MSDSEASMASDEASSISTLPSVSLSQFIFYFLVSRVEF